MDDPLPACEACGELCYRDGATKLCRPCWRAVIMSVSSTWGLPGIEPCRTCGYPKALCYAFSHSLNARSREAHEKVGMTR